MSNTPSDRRRRLYEEFRQICFYCELEIPMHLATMDHFWPRSKRGWGGRMNLVLACTTCNGLKEDRLPTLAEYHKLLEMRPETTVTDFHEPIRPDMSKRKIKALAREEERRALKKIKVAAWNKAHRDQAQERREYILYSNMAGPFFSGAGLAGGCVIRLERGLKFPFQPAAIKKIA